MDTRAPADRFFDALRKRHRRLILIALLHRAPRSGEDFGIPDEASTPPEPVENQTLTMYHAHLPKLAEMEFIEWDRETNTISRGSEFGEVEPLLRVLYEHRRELPGSWF